MKATRPPWRWIRRHRLLSAATALVTGLALAAGAVWYFVLRSPGTRVDLGQAVRLFRQGERAGGPTASDDLPAAGVYPLRSAGDEQVSVAGIGRVFPRRSFLIVTDGGACTTMEWRPFVQHMEGVRVCRGPAGSLLLVSAPSYEEIAGAQATNVLRCPPGTYFVPPNASPGRRWRALCHSPGERVRLQGQVLGLVNVSLGGRVLRAVHTRLDFFFRGADAGTNPTEYWVSAATGLILRQRESVDVTQSAGPLGSVRYTEEMRYGLTATLPITGRPAAARAPARR